MSNCVSPVLSYGELHYGYEYQICKRIFLQEKDPFHTSEDKKASIHIKRVIALPGETVQIKDGQILINGEVYNEKDEFPAITNAGLASEPITVGKGQYFVLGDNRNNSEDSRHNGMGLVDSDRIVGKLWFTISPWKKIGFV